MTIVKTLIIGVLVVALLKIFSGYTSGNSYMQYSKSGHGSGGGGGSTRIWQ